MHDAVDRVAAREIDVAGVAGERKQARGQLGGNVVRGDKVGEVAGGGGGGGGKSGGGVAGQGGDEGRGGRMKSGGVWRGQVQVIAAGGAGARGGSRAWCGRNGMMRMRM